VNASTLFRTTALTTVAAGTLALSAVAVSAATTTPAPSPSAAQQQTLAGIKARAAEAIANRETTLEDLTTAVNGTKDLTSSDRSALLALFQGDEGGLTTLGQTIAADTTIKAAIADAQKIVTDYRVYVLVVPQTHGVRVADTVTSVSATLTGIEPKLQQAIDQASLTADQRQAATEALTDMTSRVTAAQSSVATVSSTLLALTPAGYPANQPQLSAALKSDESARDDLKAARHDVEVIETILGHH
jgi:hypothetical protein